MAERLPVAEWTRRADLSAMVAALGKGQARYVGGAVRDTLLGLDVKDVDIATPLVPEHVIGRLKAAGIRTVPTGIEHGTVTALLPEGPVEITTLRRDVSTDGRRATVAFASDWREDAQRRDFTINALYADPLTGELFDWFGGLADLAARRIRFIGDARQRIHEDHLRILRYFRFQARFGSQPADEESEKACAELAPMLKGLSRERIGMETLNLLSLPDPGAVVSRMGELGVLAQFLPEARPEMLAAMIQCEASQAIAPDPLRRLAALLPADPSIAEQVAARFRLSGAQKKRLVLAARRETEPGDARALAYRLGVDAALDRLLMCGADASALSGWDLPVFPIKGGDVVSSGVKAGPKVAQILRSVEDRWVAEGFPGEARARILLAEALQG